MRATTWVAVEFASEFRLWSLNTISEQGTGSDRVLAGSTVSGAESPIRGSLVRLPRRL